MNIEKLHQVRPRVCTQEELILGHVYVGEKDPALYICVEIYTEGAPSGKQLNKLEDGSIWSYNPIEEDGDIFYDVTEDYIVQRKNSE